MRVHTSSTVRVGSIQAADARVKRAVAGTSMRFGWLVARLQTVLCSAGSCLSHLLMEVQQGQGNDLTLVCT